jgi:uncharacterized protein (TIGR03437 family)
MFSETKRVLFLTGTLLLIPALACAQTTVPIRSHEFSLPLEFEANRGQFAGDVLFLARTSHHFVYLTRDGMTLGLNSGAQSGAALQMKMVGANSAVTVAPESRLEGVSNYFIGNQPSQWQREVPHYSRIRYRTVWPGIDLVFHGRDQDLEYDFAVSPGADPSAIRLRYANARDLHLDTTGNLVIETGSGKVVQRLPEIYQEFAGIRRAVHGGFRIARNNEVQFKVDQYDRRKTLVIDPTITYSTYIAGTGTNTPSNIAVDSSGNAYLVGTVSSPDFPVVNPLQRVPTTVGLFHSSNQANTWGSASSSIGTAKVISLAPDPSNPQAAYAGTSRGLFKTTNSGSSWALTGSGLPTDAVTSVAVDPLSPATVYVCLPEGLYKSTDSGATWKPLPNAGLPTVVAVDFKNEGTIWVGSGFGYAVVSFDGGKTFFIANFPQFVTTSIAIDRNNSNNVFYGTADQALLVTNDGGLSFTPITTGLTLNPGALASVYAVAIDPHNSTRILVGTGNGAYISFTGGTSFQATQGIGNRKVLSVLFDPNTESVAVAGTAGGGVYVSNDGGQTWTATGPANLDVNALAMSSDEKNTWAGLYSPTDAFVTKINAAGTALVYSTYLGGSGATQGLSIAVDSASHAFVCGVTDAADFPTQNAYQKQIGGGTDFFISRLSASGSALDASTFLGGHADDSCAGVALDPSGNVYVAGTVTLLNAGNPDFPTTPGAFGAQPFGGEDCVVAKFDNGLQAPIYASFLGGSDSDSCTSIAADSSGNAYVVGDTFSSNFPTTLPPFGGSKAGGSTTNTPGFVTKIKPDGSGLIYSGLLGGANGYNLPGAIAVDRSGRVYITGYTEASDYPVTSNAISKVVGGAPRTMLSVIETDGSKLLYSTLLSNSGGDYAFDIALDSSGNVWLSGGAYGSSFPVTPDALPHPVNAVVYTPYVAEVDTTASKILHATYLAGSAGGLPGGLAIGSDGSVYVSGSTLSTDFPLTALPFQNSQTADYKVYLMRLGFGSTSGGVPIIVSAQNGASFQNGFASGAWMTIKGANLSTVVDTWNQTIVNGQLPTTLDGVSVSVGSQPAYVAYVSPGQINVVAPNVQPGPVSVTVTNAQGTSAAFSTTAQTYQPAFFPVSNNYVVATRQDFSLALKNGTIPGVNTVPAKPGDVIILWGTAFGPSNPAAPSGVEVPASSFPAAVPVTVMVGNQPATVYGAALAPGFAALYQVAIQIPTTLANGDYPVVATVGGQSSPVTSLITVQQ